MTRPSHGWGPEFNSRMKYILAPSFVWSWLVTALCNPACILSNFYYPYLHQLVRKTFHLHWQTVNQSTYYLHYLVSSNANSLFISQPINSNIINAFLSLTQRSILGWSTFWLHLLSGHDLWLPCATQRVFYHTFITHIYISWFGKHSICIGRHQHKMDFFLKSKAQKRSLHSCCSPKLWLLILTNIECGLMMPQASRLTVICQKAKFCSRRNYMKKAVRAREKHPNTTIPLFVGFLRVPTKKL